MPTIVIKDYTWRQCSEFVILNVPLRGHPKKVDLFVIDNYAKVSFPPYILELFLWGNIVEDKSKCTLTEEDAILTLRKTNIDIEWPTLEVQNIDKDFKRDCRNQALESAHKLAEERAKFKREKRQRLQKEAVKEQINVNTTILNKIDAIRDAHRKEAMRDFEDWRSKAELPILSNVKGEVQENRKTYEPPLKWFNDEDDKLKSRPMTDEEIFDTYVSTKKHEIKENENEKMEDDKKIVQVQSESENEENNVKTELSEKKNCFFYNTDSSSEDSESDCKDRSGCKKKESNEKQYEEKQKGRPGMEAVKAAINGNFLRRNNIFDVPSKSVPLPRKMGTINVTFSDRKFPTPARESSRVEEEEWLRKQKEAREKIGFDAADLRPEERDPQWLKDKGDEFFKVANYLAAISAYSYGIKISEKMSSLYVNRSAAHYALGNYCRCIEDCSKALELMEPKCESNRESRARCHARRGAALCKLSAPQHGIPELEAALELTPNNESIKRDVLAAKQYFDIKD
ncbi:Dyslexia susceptibility 1 candidate gene 1 protein [Habropoda laboriosa]|uniref:Dyslexia susceptibility 1 candidate gene 1 protein n=1 Tax=Habropoda laboriosa TaxID=597456 RepID=A0A0L7R456_9HYME|nr:Dyslexia susceptibility 1 candidate gene 1 protein [Habropoda laboriosa]